MLQNASFNVKIGVDTAENEPRKECCVVAAALAYTPDERAGAEQRGSREPGEVLLPPHRAPHAASSAPAFWAMNGLMVSLKFQGIALDLVDFVQSL